VCCSIQYKEQTAWVPVAVLGFCAVLCHCKSVAVSDAYVCIRIVHICNVGCMVLVAEQAEPLPHVKEARGERLRAAAVAVRKARRL
jgi:hypothetical protein